MASVALLFVTLGMPTAVATETIPSGAWLEQFRKGNPDFAELVEMSSTVRPELGARMLLTIAASPRLKHRQWKRNLLLQAFETASLVRESLPRAFVLSGTFDAFSTIGTRAQLQESFHREELDRLSLESGAVAEMIKIDPSTAKELFLRMPSPALNRPTCADVFLQDPSLYYKLLGEIAQVAFSAKERHEERHVELLSTKIREMNSPLDLAPMSDVLRSTPLSMEERGSLIAEFTIAVESMDLDDRSFSFSLFRTDETLHGLIVVSSSLGAATEALVAAYRSYLARGFSEARCADTLRNDRNTTKVVARFNNELARDGDSRLHRFEIADLKPEKVLGEPEILSFTPSVDDLIEKILDLKSTGNGDEADRKIAEATKLDRILVMFDEIEPAVGEDQDSYLMRKGLAFNGVIENMPLGLERNKLVRRYVDFLNSAADNSEDLVVWIGPLRMLLDDIDSDLSTYRALLEMLRNSPQVAVSFYARLEQLRRGER